jgi:hypothetical protein
MVEPTNDVNALQQAFAELADTMGSRAPVWSAVCRRLAHDPVARSLVEILLAAPPQQRRPVLLMAALHDVALRQGRALTTSTAVAWSEVMDLAHTHRDDLMELVTTRHTQTNDIGRCGVIMPVVSTVADEVGPVDLIEFGSSAGLLLNLDRYRYRFEHVDGVTLVGPRTPHPAAPLLHCGVRGEITLPRELPVVASRLGVDPQPVDVHDEVATRWLQACVWPDQHDRLTQLRAALEVARQWPVKLVEDDGVDRVPNEVGAAARHPVVVSSWALAYVAPRRRQQLMDRLDGMAMTRDLSMVLFEDAAQIEEIPIPRRPDDRGRTVVSLITWRSGRRSIARLGTAHPHGYWWHRDP